MYIAFPLLSHVAVWGYGLSIGIVVLLTGGMFAMIRLLNGNPDNQGEVKKFVDAMFHMPSQGGAPVSADPNGQAAWRQAAAANERDRFEEACPGCGEKVTHDHPECPSCGLRLIG